MLRGWPNIRKSCKQRERKLQQKETAPSLHLDAIKLNLQSNSSRCRKKEFCPEKNSTENVNLDSVDIRSKSDFEVLQYGKMTDGIEDSMLITGRNGTSSAGFTRFFNVAEVPRLNKTRQRGPFGTEKRCFLNIGFTQAEVFDRLQVPGKIRPRKIYRGGGYYSALAIYDRSANIHIVNVGGTKFEMDADLHKRDKPLDVNNELSFPRVQSNSRINGISSMPEELECKKISDKNIRAMSSNTVSKCRVCERARNKPHSSVGPKQIKLYLTIDI
eukprot:gene12415-3078_t